MKRIICVLAIIVVLSACNDGGEGFVGPTTTEFPANCREYLEEGVTADGVYTIDPDGDGNVDAFSAECDMTTDGGGWTLVLNYLHQGGTSPAWDIRTEDLPVIGSSTLGTNEGGTAFWGHPANSLLALFTFSESRWYCITSGHARVLHFKSSDTACNTYLSTGTGDCSAINSSATLLTGHTAHLPGTINNSGANAGDLAMLAFPYYNTLTEHWTIKSGGNRWECDDITAGAGPINNTLHRIWIR